VTSTKSRSSRCISLTFFFLRSTIQMPPPAFTVAVGNSGSTPTHTCNSLTVLPTNPQGLKTFDSTSTPPPHKSASNLNTARISSALQDLHHCHYPSNANPSHKTSIAPTTLSQCLPPLTFINHSSQFPRPDPFLPRYRTRPRFCMHIVPFLSPK
jgi:hypothetical protein